jgi:sodium/proline symporter
MTTMPELTPAYTVAAVAGLGVMLVICFILGLVARRRAASYDDYMVGRRDISPFITGCAISATYLSGWATMGMMGITYSVGWSGMWFAGVFTIFGIVPTVFLAARKLSDFSARNGTRTLGDIARVRYDSKTASTFVAAAMAILMFAYAVGQLKAAGTLWYAVTGLSPLWCLLLAVVVVILYLIIGGYTGSQWAMGFQGILLGVACFILGILALSYVGGGAGMEARLAAEDPNLLMIMRPDLPRVGSNQLFSDLIGITSCFVLFFSMSTGMPHNVARFLGMRPMKKKMDFIWLIIPVFAIAGFPIMLNATTGLCARATFGAALFDIVPWKGDLAAPFVAMAAGGVPLTTLYVTGVFAATLSTFSGMIMIIAGNIAHDIVGSWAPNIPAKNLLLLNRLLLIPVALIPFLWTLYNPPPLLALLTGQAAAGFGGMFLPTITLGLWWRRATKEGAIACVCYGLLSTLIFSYLVGRNLLGMGWAIWLIVLGSCICYVVGSLLSKPLSKEKLDQILGPAPTTQTGGTVSAG